MNIPCDVILDLIPLVKDGVASDESNRIVKEHIKICSQCKAEFETLKTINSQEINLKDEKVILSIKRSIFISQIIILTAGAMLGVAFSDSISMFYNFMIMPLIGSISLFALKEKWYLTPIAVFILTYLRQIGKYLVNNGLFRDILYDGLYYSTIYIILVVIGVIIAKLFIFALKSKSKRQILKILAGITAIALICGIFFVTNAFVGNPISSILADKAIKEYVDKEYPFLDLEIEKAVYNFKGASYIGVAKSRTSIDTYFRICYRNGKVQSDTYESNVLKKFNTLQRLSAEYSHVAKNIIAKELGYQNNSTIVRYNDENRNIDDIIELDMKFDRTLPIDTEVIIRLDLKDNSIEEISRVLINAHKAFIDNGCHFSKYGLFSENDEVLVMVNDVTPADIESGKLTNLLEEAYRDENNGISVFIQK